LNAKEDNNRKEVIIMDKEVKNKKVVGEGVKFDRIRRITGYLVGTLDRFNNAKKAEVNDRVTHATK
jgi:anaerobic ribonucleoside-triphosphate reductase